MQLFFVSFCWGINTQCADKFFFETLRNFLRTNLSYCIIIALIISAYTCLMMIPLVTDFFLVE